MTNGQTPAEPVPLQAVPSASGLGAVLGWSLVALGVACFIASIVAGQQADAAAEAIRRAQAAFVAAFVADPHHTAAASAALAAATAAKWEATLREYLLAGATLMSLFIVPGLLYAVYPSLLGGPLGRLLRLQPAARGMQGEHRHRRQRFATIYQGVGLALCGVGLASFYSMAALTPTLLSGPAWWLLLFAGLLWVATCPMGLVLVAGGELPHWQR